MAKFAITTARQELGFTPSTAVRADVDTRTAAGAVGEAIGQGAVALARQGLKSIQRNKERRLRIEDKRRQMTDANNAVLANKLRQVANEEFDDFKLVNPQETWEDFRQKQTQDVSNKVSQLNFSPDALELQRVKSESYSEVETAKALTSATRQLRTDTVEAQTESLTAAFRSGDPKEIAESIVRYRDNGANMGKDKVEVLNDIKSARESGEKLRKQDTLDKWRGMIAEEPAKTAELLGNELEARKTDEGIISEDELTSADIQSLLNTATNRQSQLLADTERKLNAKNRELETQLHDDIVDGKASITDVSNSSLPAAAKRRLEQDLSDIDKRNIQNTWAIQDTNDATTGKNGILLNLESGSIDINEARSLLSEISRRTTPDDRSIITRKTFEKTMEQFKKGGRDAIDVFTGEQTVKVTNVLIGRLTEREARLRVRAIARTLTSRERRQFSTTGFLLQVEKHQLNLYNEGLANRLRNLGIENTSGKEAKVEAVNLWSGIKQKNLSQKIDEFLEFSNQKLIKPFGFPNDTWDISDARNRAAIVNAVSKGMSNEQIQELLIK